MIQNVFSIDLESWVHAGYAQDRRKSDGGFIPDIVSDMLRILKKNDVKTTFFVVAEIYEWYPEIIDTIKESGHEIGYHTHTHKILENGMILKDEISLSWKFIAKFKPKSFRAPMMHFRDDYYKIIGRHGFRHDSSVYGQRFHNIDGILEMPVSTFRLSGKPRYKYPMNISASISGGGLPFGSGYFISIFGKSTSYFIKKLNERGMPSILFIHPWQISNINRHANNKGMIFNLMALPYALNCRKSFIKILQRHNFCTMEELAENIGM